MHVCLQVHYSHYVLPYLHWDDQEKGHPNENLYDLVPVSLQDPATMGIYDKDYDT